MMLAPASLKLLTGRKGHNGTLHMSEAEFVKWAMAQELVRVEWVNGRVVFMAPVSGGHSDLGWWLQTLTKLYVDDHDLGLVRGPEFMTRLPKIPSRRVPDVLFIAKARLSLLKPNHFEGAPDLIMEVVSPDSESRDWREKYREYEKSGVREYWVVDPNSKSVEAYALGKGKHYRPIPERAGVIRSAVIKGFWIKTEWLWPESRPSVLIAAKALGIRM